MVSWAEVCAEGKARARRLLPWVALYVLGVF